MAKKQQPPPLTKIQGLSDKKKLVKNVPKKNVLVTTKNFKAIEKEAKVIPGYNKNFFTKLWTTLKKKELAK